MPKQTFNNLPVERQTEILAACRLEFEENSLATSSVSNIVSRLNIARGSFYKYFEDLEDCYFYLLSIETKEIHALFLELMRETDFNLADCLEKYGERVAREIHQQSKYMLYKNRYLGWTPALQLRWQDYCRLNDVEVGRISEIIDLDSKRVLLEIMQILKAVVHNIVEQNFLENWSEQEFVNVYKRQIAILINGLKTYMGR